MDNHDNNMIIIMIIIIIIIIIIVSFSQGKLFKKSYENKTLLTLGHYHGKMGEYIFAL